MCTHKARGTSRELLTEMFRAWIGGAHEIHH
jgi:hypothetical protein